MNWEWQTSDAMLQVWQYNDRPSLGIWSGTWWHARVFPVYMWVCQLCVAIKSTGRARFDKATQAQDQSVTNKWQPDASSRLHIFLFCLQFFSKDGDLFSFKSFVTFLEVILHLAGLQWKQREQQLNVGRDSKRCFGKLGCQVEMKYCLVYVSKKYLLLYCKVLS